MLVARKTVRVSRKDLVIQQLSKLQDLTALEAELDSLAASCHEPNVFYELWMLIPAIKYLLSDDQRKRVRFFLTWENKDGSSELVGFFPFIEYSSYNGIPLLHLRSLHHCHCYLTTPLIKSGYEALSWQVLFDWIKSNTNYQFCRLSYLGGETAAYNDCIKSAKLAKNHVVETDHYVRSCMRVEKSFPEYLRVKVNRKVKKDLRRKFRRLSEHGAVDFKVLEKQEAVSDWIIEFLELEAKGWKGRSKVAIVNDAGHIKFFREVCQAAHARGVLNMLKLSLAGEVIAIKCAFRSQSVLFAFKIAYDEQFSNCSPGVLLEFEHLQWLCGQSEITWVDSCMDHGNFMISRLYKESRIIRFVNISSGSTVSKLAIALVPMLKRVRAVFRSNPETLGCNNRG